MTYELLPEYAQLKDFLLSLPQKFENGEGVLIHSGRNQLRRFEVDGISLVVKSYRRPNLVNRFVYGLLRASKAKRSIQHAQTLMKLGIETPPPVGYVNIRRFGLFDRSFLVTRTSACTHHYAEIINAPDAYDDVLRVVAWSTARMHEAHLRHLDYSRGNILFRRDDEGRAHVELIDLNRMRKGNVGIEMGCKNFERLPATPHMHRIMAEVYARERGLDAERCYDLMQQARRRVIDGEEY